MGIETIKQTGMKKVHKNLYFDYDTQSYAFINGNERREVVTQEAYLMIYIIELLKEGQDGG